LSIDDKLIGIKRLLRFDGSMVEGHVVVVSHQLLKSLKKWKIDKMKWIGVALTLDFGFSELCTNKVITVVMR